MYYIEIFKEKTPATEPANLPLNLHQKETVHNNDNMVRIPPDDPHE